MLRDRDKPGEEEEEEILRIDRKSKSRLRSTWSDFKFIGVTKNIFGVTKNFFKVIKNIFGVTQSPIGVTLNLLE